MTIGLAKRQQYFDKKNKTAQRWKITISREKALDALLKKNGMALIPAPEAFYPQTVIDFHTGGRYRRSKPKCGLCLRRVFENYRQFERYFDPRTFFERYFDSK